MVSLEKIIRRRNGREAVFNGSWYRGQHTHFIPSKIEIEHTAESVDLWIMEGWKPEKPFITKDMTITAFGSCFAANISTYLRRKGYAVSGAHLNNQSHLIRFGEGMVNTFSILQQLEWALEGKEFTNDLWISKEMVPAPVDEQVKNDTKRIILDTDVFIITLGLSEIWYDKRSGEALWRAVPAHLFDDNIHGFRISSHGENLENLRRMRSLILSQKPDAKIIFTVSPVPLMATFRPISCLSANSVSKSILRSAVDELVRESRSDRVLYFPSFDIVKEFFVDPYEDDNRHPRAEIIEFIMQTFDRHYCV